MLCHHAQHMSNMGPNLFLSNENSAYIMRHVTTHAVMSCVHCAAHTCRQAGHPYENVGYQKLLMDTLFMPAELCLIKLTASHFNRNMSKSKGWTLQSSLLTLWMEKTRVNNQTKIDDDKNLLISL